MMERNDNWMEVKLYFYDFFFILYSVPTWICAVPRREKKVTPIFSSEMLKIDESMEDPLWGLDCENLDEETGCSKRNE